MPEGWQAKNDTVISTNETTGKIIYHNYAGPHYHTKQIGLATAVRGEILQMDPPATNAFWTLNLTAPVIQCKVIDENMRQSIIRNVMVATFCAGSDGSAWPPYSQMNQDLAAPFGYLGWTIPYDAEDQTQFNSFPVRYSSEPSFTSTLNPKRRTDSGYFSAWDGQTQFGSGQAAVYMAVFPRVAEVTSNSSTNFSCIDARFRRVKNREPVSQLPSFEGGDPYSSEQDNNDIPLTGLFDTANIMQCRLHNASYAISLRYLNGTQSLHVENVTTREPIVALGGLFSSDNCSTLQSTLSDKDQLCRVDSNAAQTLA